MRVSKDLAVQLDQLGYRCPTTHMYVHDETDDSWGLDEALDFTGNTEFTYEDAEEARENGYQVYLAPLLTDVQAWLRKFHVDVLPRVAFFKGLDEASKVPIYDVYVGNVYGSTTLGAWTARYSDGFDTYEEALEVGIGEALVKAYVSHIDDEQILNTL